MKKALIVCTIVNFLKFEINDLLLLKNSGYEIHCATNFSHPDMELLNELNMLGIVNHKIDFARSPCSKTNITAYYQLKQLMEYEDFDLLHCHTPVGGVLARIVARKYRKKGMRVIYTAHGFHFYAGAPLLNWLIYYPIEKWLSRFTDVLITINNEDYQRAKKKFHAKETKYIPGVGIDVEKIQAVQVDREKKREELGIGKDDFLLLSVGELNKNKNHELGDPKIKYAICGQGPLKEYLEELAEKLGVRNQLFLLGFRTDVIEICKSADVFVFPSKREGLSVALMEAMACGLPCIVSKIRGNMDLVVDKENGFLFGIGNVDEFNKKMLILLRSKEVRVFMNKRNIQRSHDYTIENTKKIMCAIYGEKI